MAELTVDDLHLKYGDTPIRNSGAFLKRADAAPGDDILPPFARFRIGLSRRAARQGMPAGAAKYNLNK